MTARNYSNPLGLTNAQIRVIEYAGQGMSNKVIARVLGREPKTIEHHMWAACRRLGVNRRKAAFEKLNEIKGATA